MEIKTINSNLSTIVDIEDLDKIIQQTGGNIFANKDKNGNLLCVSYNEWNGKRNRNRNLGRLILNYFGKLEIDHIDRNVLNNKRDNLRLVTRAQNLMHRGKNRKGGSSRYKGVIYRKDRETWKAEITVDGQTISGGHFKTEIEAARQANLLMQFNHKEFAVCNIIEEDN